MPHFRFGDFSLDTDSRELIWRGRRLQIRKGLYDLLAYLLEHRSHVVEKKELVSEVWGLTRLSDSAIRSAIRDLRDLVGGEDVIETVRSRGYRFVAHVEVETAESGSPPVPNPASLEETPIAAMQSLGAALVARADRLARELLRIVPFSDEPASLTLDRMQPFRVTRPEDLYDHREALRRESDRTVRSLYRPRLDEGDSGLLPAAVDSLERIVAGLGRGSALAILGDPGMGKTAAGVCVFVSQAEAFCASLSGIEPAPDRAPLRARDPSLLPIHSVAADLFAAPDVTRFLVEQALDGWTARDEDERRSVMAVVEQHVRSGKILLIIDALDQEWREPGREPEDLLDHRHWKTLWNDTGKPALIVTSRSAGYRTPTKVPELASTSWELSGWSPRQARTFVMQYPWRHPETARPRTLQLLEEPAASGLAQVPLLLGLLCWVCDDAPDEEAPTTRAELYFRFVTRLLARNLGVRIDDRMQALAALALAYQRAGTDSLPRDVVLRALRTESSLGDVDPDKLVYKGGILLRIRPSIPDSPLFFLHRTIQEYLAAFAIVQSGKWREEIAAHLWYDERWDQVIPLVAGELARRGEHDAACSLVRWLLVQGDDDLLTLRANAFWCSSELSGIHKQEVMNEVLEELLSSTGNGLCAAVHGKRILSYLQLFARPMRIERFLRSSTERDMLSHNVVRDNDLVSEPSIFEIILREFKENPSASVKASAADALRYAVTTDQRSDAVAALEKEINQEETVRAVAIAAIDSLVELRAERWEVVDGLIGLLAKLLDPPAEIAPKRLPEVVVFGENWVYPGTVLRGLALLGRRWSSKVIPIVERCLDGERPIPGLAAQALALLSLHESESRRAATVAILRSKFKLCEELEQKQIAFSLALLGNYDSSVMTLLLRSPLNSSSLKALNLSSHAQRPEHVTTLLAQLGSLDPQERKDAADLIGHLGLRTPKAVRAIREQAYVETEAEVLGSLAATLGRIAYGSTSQDEIYAELADLFGRERESIHVEDKRDWNHIRFGVAVALRRLANRGSPVRIQRRVEWLVREVDEDNESAWRDMRTE